MQVIDVWLNETHLTIHYGGYLPFVLDISDHVNASAGASNLLRLRNRASALPWEAQMNETDNHLVAAELYRIVHEEYPVAD